MALPKTRLLALIASSLAGLTGFLSVLTLIVVFDPPSLGEIYSWGLAFTVGMSTFVGFMYYFLEVVLAGIEDDSMPENEWH